MTDKTSEKTNNEPTKDIKFRAWHKSLKQIFEVHSLYYSGGTLFWVDLVQNGFVEHEYVDIDNVVMLQYTNMKDKNKTKTYRVILNAADVGKYYLPTVYCEAMYNNEINSSKAGKWVSVVKPGGAQIEVPKVVETEQTN